jgi:ABC-type branched-subunit amino acid transport system ATPase component
LVESVLEAESLYAGYQGRAVVRDLSLSVRPGEVVALLGVNGAGKSTTMMTLAGVLPPVSGRVHLHGRPRKDPLHRRAREGLSYVSEERCVFAQMSTIDNLRVARCDVDHALSLFPELKQRLRLKVGLMSGGEQQMLALARTLSRYPKVLLADELSLGLAPLVVTRLLQAVRQAADGGVGVLLVEQHVSKALEVADRVYVMAGGQITLSGTTAEVRTRLQDIEASYFGGRPAPGPRGGDGRNGVKR